MKKRIISLLLTAVMAVSLTVPALADEESELQSKVAAAEAELAGKEAELEDLRIQQEQIQSQISAANSDIVDLMIQIDQAGRDITATEQNIADKTAEIAETQKSLEEAEARRARQYADMKKRIQYIYENGGNIGWASVLLNAKDFTSFMNKAEYASELHEADRAALAAFAQTVSDIANFKSALEQQKADFDEGRVDMNMLARALTVMAKAD